MRIAVTGLNGQVVSALVEQSREQNLVIIPVGRPHLDLENAASITKSLTDICADVIVSAAAYTAVDAAETNEDLAYAINGVGAGCVSRVAAELDVPIVHISTDYVFDGEKTSPYVETDVTNPLGVYGASKLAGEKAVAAANPNHIILRTAWVYSPFGNNFLKTMLRVAKDRNELGVVGDQVGSPTCALDIANGILQVSSNLLQNPNRHQMRGIFHMTATGETSWAGFAKEIFSQSTVLGGSVADVTVIETSAYPTPAHRPKNSRLECAKLTSEHGVTLPEWRQSVANIVKRVL